VAIPHFVVLNQSACIPNRFIMHKICEDLVRMYHMKGTAPRCIMKMDLGKAMTLCFGSV